jgi:nicotinamide-nucleotide amidase
MDDRGGRGSAPDRVTESIGTHADEATDQQDLVALAERIQAACLAGGVTVATAESCTGGLIGHVLTEIAGSSGYYVGGAITYSDAMKQTTLGVPAATLDAHGAVSAQVAVAMAEGARRAFGADVAVAVTGIAGPTGGSDRKPVGLTYVAVADANGHDVQRHLWTGSRSANKLDSARAALSLLVARLADAGATGTSGGDTGDVRPTTGGTGSAAGDAGPDAA